MSTEDKLYVGMNASNLRHIDSRATANSDAEPELEKKFSVWSLGSLCLCLMATWEALSTVVAQALVSGKKARDHPGRRNRDLILNRWCPLPLLQLVSNLAEAHQTIADALA